MDTMAALSFAASIVGAVLGLVAIGVTLALYITGHKISAETLKALVEIKSSFRTAEATSTRTTGRVVDGLIDIARTNLTANLAAGRSTASERIDDILRKDPATADPETTRRLKAAIVGELNNVF